jgi:LysR family cyn operon transcriptional activator
MTGVVRIGTTHNFNMRIMPRCISLFVAQFPLVRVEVTEMAANDIVSSLLRNGLDLGVTYKHADAPTLRFEALFTEEMMLAVSTHHPFAKRRFVRMSELHRQKMVLLPHPFSTRLLLEENFRLANATPIVVAEMNAIAPTLELVSNTDIATIVSQYAVRREDVRMIPLESPTPTRTPGLLWRMDESRSEAARALASTVRSVSTEEGRNIPSHRRVNRRNSVS